MQKLLLGDEAVAQGAIDAGISGVYAYPGTPSTEITEYIQNSKQAEELNIRCEWMVNEKTAMESAIGMSYAGKRSIVCMKHVGLNVAADAFMNSSIVGANGGLVVVVADDPSMHSSQNEQDTRVYGKFALMPTLEPSNQQECYDLVRYGLDFSEEFKVPVLLRLTTRISHSRAGVVCGETRKQNELSVPKNLKQFILLPAISRINYKSLLSKQDDFISRGESDGWNKYIDGEDKKYGIIASGIAYNYLMENYPDRKVPYPVIKICQYPIPEKMINKLAKETDSLMIMEEGYPFIEEQIKGILESEQVVHGRLDGTLPRTGELNPNLVADALGLPNDSYNTIPSLVQPRPPKLCVGCPHISTYEALNEALKDYSPGRVFADIGCYTLGALPPYDAINTCVDMGASITMSIGAYESGLFPSVAVIGDSTFTHSGMTGLLDAILAKAGVTILILDNETTGMTGGQDSSAYSRIENICLGIGVEKEHLHVINPLPKFHDENVKILKQELEYKGVSVIIPRRICVQVVGKPRRRE